VSEAIESQSGALIGSLVRKCQVQIRDRPISMLSIESKCQRSQSLAPAFVGRDVTNHKPSLAGSKSESSESIQGIIGS
jgi:hypothetical protein